MGVLIISQLKLKCHKNKVKKGKKMGNKMGVLIINILMISVLGGCATYPANHEALDKANEALEQAEKANQRIDQILETWNAK
jgi:hypothetical protein